MTQQQREAITGMWRAAPFDPADLDRARTALNSTLSTREPAERSRP
jgi:hypothetical protein